MDSIATILYRSIYGFYASRACKIKKPSNVGVACLCYGQASHLISGGHQMLKCWYPPCIGWSLNAKMLMYPLNFK
jgi:hypothetical protein